MNTNIRQLTLGLFSYSQSVDYLAGKFTLKETDLQNI